jgi:hypothetical protein
LTFASCCIMRVTGVWSGRTIGGSVCPPQVLGGRGGAFAFLRDSRRFLFVIE